MNFHQLVELVVSQWMQFECALKFSTQLRCAKNLIRSTVVALVVLGIVATASDDEYTVGVCEGIIQGLTFGIVSPSTTDLGATDTTSCNRSTHAQDTPVTGTSNRNTHAQTKLLKPTPSSYGMRAVNR